MNWKKLGKALLYPHLALMILLVPVATAFLVFSMVVLGTESPLAYVSYVLAAYTLTVWCFKIPSLVKFFKTVKNENKYVVRWREDDRLRVGITLLGSTLWNAAYAALQAWLGYLHSTFWFYSLAAYYLCLAVMRLYLGLHMGKHIPGTQMKKELVKYRNCAWILLVMNLAISLMIFFMVYWNRTFLHDEITTITMAAYTFTSFTFAILGILRYRKYNSPVYSATKAIGLASASVSMLTLSSTMLTTFNDGTMSLSDRKLMLGLIGGAVAAFILTMAIGMIVRASKKIKAIKTETDTNGTEA